MDSFLKFLEGNCPGDDAHNGCAEPNKPLLERCELCASIYEAHKKELTIRLGELLKESQFRIELAELWISQLREAIGAAIGKLASAPDHDILLQEMLERRKSVV